MLLFDLLRRLARCTSGTATLEAAIVLPIAISLMAGGVEFGRVFLAYGTAEKSIRDATRYIARVPSKDSSGNLTGAICGWGLANARNLAMYGNLTGTGQPLIPNWTNPATVTLNNIDCNNPSIIDLRAAVPYAGLMFGVIGMSNIWTMRVKHEERWIGE